jgi:glycosyltransferase involved in cell wall biosynthesis
MKKPKLAIVSSHKVCCALAYYAEALKNLLSPAFEVEIIDLKTSALLRQEGENYRQLSDAHIEQLCIKLQQFDIVNIHLELGLYGTTTEQIASRIIKLCQASGRLILTVHTIDYKADGGHAHLYQEIMRTLKKRPASNPFHLIAHLPKEGELLKKHFDLNNVSDFPLIFLTNERRKYFKQLRNPSVWKQQFGLKEEDITIGVFGILSAYKNYLHALRTLNLLPSHYKLLIIGEAHHMNIKEWQVDPVVQEMVTYLDSRPTLADRVVFTGRRDDTKYYEDIANVDFVLLPTFEAGQSGSATLCNALELSCNILKSNNLNAREYEIYFPNCFEVFDIGNHYETKHKIINFDKTKTANLRKRSELFSEAQLQQMYMNIYETMKACIPIDLSSSKTHEQTIKKMNRFDFSSKKIFYRLPRPAQALLRKIRNKLLKK